MSTRIAPGVGANLLGQHATDHNPDATAYIGNLDPQFSEELLWELCLQAGPVDHVEYRKDRVTNAYQSYAFVTFHRKEDADYAIKVLNMVKLYGKPLRVNKTSQGKKSVDIGANLYVGNLDPDVDEKLLYDTFSAFGVIVSNPKIMRDPETGNSRGFGFIDYDSFEASDAAIEAMNGQYLCYRQINVSYAYKKETKGERHGTPAERVLASSNPGTQRHRPHTKFATGPPVLPNVQANGSFPTTPVPSQPYANGGVPPPPMPAMRPPPPQIYPPMQMPPPPSCQGQPGQQQFMPPPQMQQYRGMPPPPPHMAQQMSRPPPPPAGMGAPQAWRPPPPPRQLAGGAHSTQHMSMPPPPPHHAP